MKEYATTTVTSTKTILGETSSQVRQVYFELIIFQVNCTSIINIIYCIKNKNKISAIISYEKTNTQSKVFGENN